MAEHQIRPVSVRLPADLLAEADQVAEAEARTRTSLIHIAIKEYLERHHGQTRSVA